MLVKTRAQHLAVGKSRTMQLSGELDIKVNKDHADLMSLWDKYLSCINIDETVRTNFFDARTAAFPSSIRRQTSLVRPVLQGYRHCY